MQFYSVNEYMSALGLAEARRSARLFFRQRGNFCGGAGPWKADTAWQCWPDSREANNSASGLDAGAVTSPSCRG